MNEQIYHLLVTTKCDHNCPMCCNKLYDLDNLPSVTAENLREATTVCITGGEPFLIASRFLLSLCHRIRKQFPNVKNLYIYTSGSCFGRINFFDLAMIFTFISGINIAPKNKHDWERFIRFIKSPHVKSAIARGGSFSNRLYVFEDQARYWEAIKEEFHIELDSSWSVIYRKWDSTFNTPDNEHFVRLPILYE